MAAGERRAITCMNWKRQQPGAAAGQCACPQQGRRPCGTGAPAGARPFTVSIYTVRTSWKVAATLGSAGTMKSAARGHSAVAAVAASLRRSKEAQLESSAGLQIISGQLRKEERRVQRSAGLCRLAAGGRGLALTCGGLPACPGLLHRHLQRPQRMQPASSQQEVVCSEVVPSRLQGRLSLHRQPNIVLLTNNISRQPLRPIAQVPAPTALHSGSGTSPGLLSSRDGRLAECRALLVERRVVRLPRCAPPQPAGAAMSMQMSGLCFLNGTRHDPASAPNKPRVG